MLKTAVLLALFTVAGSIRWAAVSRTSAPSRRGAVLCSANQCPLTGLELPPCPFSSDSGTAADSSSTGPPSAFDAATALERDAKQERGQRQHRVQQDADQRPQCWAKAHIRGAHTRQPEDGVDDAEAAEYFVRGESIFWRRQFSVHFAQRSR